MGLIKITLSSYTLNPSQSNRKNDIPNLGEVSSKQALNIRAMIYWLCFVFLLLTIFFFCMKVSDYYKKNKVLSSQFEEANQCPNLPVEKKGPDCMCLEPFATDTGIYKELTVERTLT